MRDEGTDFDDVRIPDSNVRQPDSVVEVWRRRRFSSPNLDCDDEHEHECRECCDRADRHHDAAFRVVDVVDAELSR